MQEDKTSNDLPIGWVAFLAIVTWLDWLGVFAFVVGSSSLVVSRGMFFVVVVLLLIWLRAVLGSDTVSQVQRIALALGIVWLLVLPCIPWDPQKSLIMDAARLRQGMTNAQVRSIMATHQGVHDSDGRGIFFCADPDWRNDVCENGTNVTAQMIGGQLDSVDIDMD
jgi:hypothetical protein